MPLEGAASHWSGGRGAGVPGSLPGVSGGLRHPGELALWPAQGALVRPAAVPSTLDICPCDCRRQQLGLFVISIILWFRIWW